MPPHLAVLFSGVFNFLGVLLGGVGVAYAIVHLLPVELLINVNTGHGLAMVFSLLAAAITRTSALLVLRYSGLQFAHADRFDTRCGSGQCAAQRYPAGRWRELAESDRYRRFAGVLAAGRLYRCGPGTDCPEMVASAVEDAQDSDQRRKLDDKKHPPFWNRLVLVISAMAVSFVHGSNDGQKGIGLIMLVLIGIVPSQFVLDLTSTTYQIERTRDATQHLNQFYQRNSSTLGEYLAMGKAEKATCRPALPVIRSRPNLPSTRCSIA